MEGATFVKDEFVGGGSDQTEKWRRHLKTRQRARYGLADTDPTRRFETSSKTSKTRSLQAFELVARVDPPSVGQTDHAFPLDHNPAQWINIFMVDLKKKKNKGVILTDSCKFKIAIHAE